MRVLTVLGMLIVWHYAAYDALARQAVAPSTCLPGDFGKSRVVSVLLPGGSDRHIDEFWVAKSFVDANRTLATTLRHAALPGVLMEQRVGQWKTYSFWRRELFCVIQVRAAGARRTYGLLTLTDYRRMRGATSHDRGISEAGPRFEPPSWWPRLRASKVERWLDTDRRVTTMTGLSSHSIASTQEQIARAVARGGFLPGAQMLVPSSAIGQSRSKRAGLMLLFQGPGRELAVTLTATAGLTSVVAHLEEH